MCAVDVDGPYKISGGGFTSVRFPSDLRLDIAQFGSASDLGSEGRVFKSHYPGQGSRYAVPLVSMATAETVKPMCKMTV